MKKITFALISLVFVLTACSSTVVEEPIVEEAIAPVQETDSLEELEPIPTPVKYEGDLELPINGATGYTSIDLNVMSSPTLESETVETLRAGTAFTIHKEEGNWWFIKNETSEGWVDSTYCFINLPDVIPSIVYDSTNTYSSEFVSSGKTIPGITGQVLYEGKTFNERLGKEEFIVPVLYSMSKKIFLAQQEALANDNTLVIYEGYRPYSAQKAVVAALTKLANVDKSVMAGINTAPWSTNWFIATSVSNHQMGYAIDVMLAKIDSKEEVAVGEYLVVDITDYSEYTMPTPMHELSLASITFTKPVPSTSPTAWKNAKLADSMNESAITLQKYLTNAGLTPLASEWWHFNDLDAMNAIKQHPSDGGYVLTECLSVSP
ncbi:M15 family metallopeptidase [Fredinandcohnia sp. QZ13]|uniref:M15 family metallopeptidase n=1 Tax=Fredinandcohnia sp. QZ13 TaxID=3073144 RepID=UPI0028534B7F|nr:M15 family metallopeptidase [Fredinandcohnia sp. QZ13]MDR4890043.1 M15 family metallopeptidase [Fredinandcohnia sp. QZ13]